MWSRAKTIAAGVLLLCLMDTAARHVSAATTEYESLVEGFFARVAEGKPGDAVNLLYDTSPYAKRFPDQIEQLRRQFINSTDLLNAYYTYEVILEKNLADRWVYMWVLGVYDRAPVFFEFTFYKPEKTWRLQNFRFGSGDEIEDEIRLNAKFRVWPFETESGNGN